MDALSILSEKGKSALSHIPPPIKYLPDASESKTSTKLDHEPIKPKFAEHNWANIEEDVHRKSCTLIFPIEVKRRHILGLISDDNNNKEIDDCNDNGENHKLTLSELYYQDQYIKDAIKQIYSYMVENECQFGVISTYNNN
ncbi:17028_t:CDS:2, partial [Entrophospora sp. SA101]